MLPRLLLHWYCVVLFEMQKESVRAKLALQTRIPLEAIGSQQAPSDTSLFDLSVCHHSFDRIVDRIESRSVMSRALRIDANLNSFASRSRNLRYFGRKYTTYRMEPNNIVYKYLQEQAQSISVSISPLTECIPHTLKGVSD